MISEDEYLERIVAGIHAVTTTGAEVTWNEVINERQFDVVVRFKLGSLRYLVLVEVKNRTRKTSVGDMDGFVTKARDQKANKAVFVTAAGFQEGALEVAKRHGVDLFTVTFDDTQARLPEEAAFLSLRKRGTPQGVAPEVNLGEPILAANVESITLLCVDGVERLMPEEPSQLTYYTKKTKLEDGRTISEIVERGPLPRVVFGETQTVVLPIDPPQRVSPPDDYFFQPAVVKGCQLTVTGRMARPIRGNTLVEPTTFTCPIVYTNVFTGEAARFSIDQLPLGLSRVCPGKFYFISHPLIYYYCESIKGALVTWHVIESFQNGELYRATVTQDIKYSQHYIPVSDKKILNRLQRRLEAYLGLSKKNAR